ncbi:sugar phosphate isomerase/epimerase family protein [Neorhodopirellula pilleata]|uniref:Inosose dehydratase n=1 Tax=Neorhodopirellula pilleata TaxID=2714738 RepID=A0A5C6A4N8_9BACT|nr:sugar phosphate isomerase/epimerase family protein [Neorhodopirellula pilleata]TWT94355.1 Inosose dehydratase [Neorhodopirellula pilleata]
MLSNEIQSAMNASFNRRHAAKLVAAGSLAAYFNRVTHADDLATDSPPDADAAPSEQGQPAPKAELPYFDRIGLQLYTLRNQMADAPQATLEAVAKAGYFQVELMNIDEDAVKIASMARDAGLAIHSGFLDFNVITEPGKDGVASIEQVLDLAERIGLRHVVFGYIAKHQRDTADKCRAIADRANDAARKTREAGMRMCYHNHSFEFQKFAGDNSDQPLTAFDLFVERFDPHQLEFELDVFWVKVGGHDPLAMMKRLAGRISQVHLKDMQQGTPVITDEGQVPDDAFQELGDGVINIPAVVRLAREIGVEQCHVEQDQSPAPLESIVQSYQYLQGKA